MERTNEFQKMEENQTGKRILITGGTGLLGNAITGVYQKAGFEVAWLSRKKESKHKNAIRIFHWDPKSLFIEKEAIDWTDIIINLAGCSIGETRWTEEGKKEILESRILAIKTLAKGLLDSKKKLDSFIGVSGAGYYGSGEVPFKESDPPGKDFPAMVAQKWEEEYFAIPESAYQKMCILRLGVVLSTKGGALPRIMQPIKYGLGAAIGTGNQGLNWIHIEDAARGFLSAMKWDGIYNLSAPVLARNKEVTRAIAKAMGKRIIFPPVPSFILELALGDRAKLLTEGNFSELAKIEKEGFRFLHPEIMEATSHLIQNGL
jgi:uncharacterized protein (TIGR01777 family)